MAEYTKNYNLEKQQGNEYVSIEGLNKNFDTVDAVLGNAAKFEKAGGTATAISLTGVILENGASKTFIVSGDNGCLQTTINDKSLYKPGTETAPNLTAGKAATVWYDQQNDCFFIKASAEGTAVADNVLAGKTFSNEYDTNISGKMPDYSACPMNGGYVIAKSVKADGGGNVVYEPPTGYYKEGVNTAGFGALIHKEPQFVSENIKAGTTPFGITGTFTSDATATAGHILVNDTAYVNGVKVIGTMPNRGTAYQTPNQIISGSPSGKLIVVPPEGYYPGVSGVAIDDPDFVSGNIISTANIFGLQGTAVAGKRFASGTVTSITDVQYAYERPDGSGLTNCGSIPIANLGLTFTPRIIITINLNYISTAYALSIFVRDGVVSGYPCYFLGPIRHKTAPYDYIPSNSAAPNGTHTWYAYE